MVPAKRKADSKVKSEFEARLYGRRTTKKLNRQNDVWSEETPTYVSIDGL